LGLPAIPITPGRPFLPVAGAIKGVGKGLLGAVANPISGMLDAMSATTEGLGATFGKPRADLLVLTRRRLPRVVSGTGKVLPLLRDGNDKQARRHRIDAGLGDGGAAEGTCAASSLNPTQTPLERAQAVPFAWLRSAWGAAHELGASRACRSQAHIEQIGQALLRNTLRNLLGQDSADWRLQQAAATSGRPTAPPASDVCSTMRAAPPPRMARPSRRTHPWLLLGAPEGRQPPRRALPSPLPARAEGYEEHFVLPEDRVVILTTTRMLLLVSPGFAQMDAAAEVGALSSAEVAGGALRWSVRWDDLLTFELRWSRESRYPDRLVVHRKGRPGARAC
jgi:hypothetical protein